MFAFIDTLAPAFLQASFVCAAASLPVWLLLEWAVRRWPVISLSRSVWLLSQLVILAAFVLALLPQSAQLSVLPPIAIERAAGAPNSAPHIASPMLVDAMIEAASDEDGDGHTGATWLRTVAGVWLAVYGAGVTIAGARLLRARRALRRLVASSQRLTQSELAAHAGFAETGAFPVAVHETDADVSPMLIGLARPVLLIPRGLRAFEPAQQRLIVTHELTHLRRRDPLLLHASLMLQTLFWFNPAQRALGERLRWAQELGCDRAVLRGRVQGQRQQYAAALVLQLKLQLKLQLESQLQARHPAALSFGGAAHDSMSARIRLIRQDPPAAGSAKTMVLAMLAALLVGGGMLQPVFAWRADAAPVIATTAPIAITAATVPEPQWRAPFAKPRVSSFYGAYRANKPAGHDGIDFAARIGTPVLAIAGGVVVDSTDVFDRAQLGKVIVIEHANGMRSTYAHLDQRSVPAGAVVAAGREIGMSGASGKVSGPHLHLEVTDGARHIDPASLIAGLDRNAFPSALRKRDRGAIR